MKPIVLDTNAEFSTLISRSRRLAFDVAVIPDTGNIVTGGPEQPAMTSVQIIRDVEYVSKAAKSDDPNWNNPAPLKGD